MMNTRCLMIKTKDKRKFFTHEKNFPQLIEFSKTFKAEISLVQVVDPTILELAQLAPAICDANFVAPPVQDCELIEIKMAVEPRKNRGKILRLASQIKSFIQKKFLKGEVVALRDLRRRYKRYNLSVPCLSNHIARVRQELAVKGKAVERVGAGKYQIQK
jgi:hypothetical protein